MINLWVYFIKLTKLIWQWIERNEINMENYAIKIEKLFKKVRVFLRRTEFIPKIHMNVNPFNNISWEVHW